MMKRKYIVHVSGVGIAAILIIYATTCSPLPFSEILRISRQYVDPACVVQSYNVEIPELPQTPSPVTFNNSAIFGTPASNTSLSNYPGTLTRIG